MVLVASCSAPEQTTHGRKVAEAQEWIFSDAEDPRPEAGADGETGTKETLDDIP